jgi:hypothetical protein
MIWVLVQSCAGVLGLIRKADLWEIPLERGVMGPCWVGGGANTRRFVQVGLKLSLFLLLVVYGTAPGLRGQVARMGFHEPPARVPSNIPPLGLGDHRWPICIWAAFLGRQMYRKPQEARD